MATPMTPTREQVYLAVWNLAKNAYNFKTASRRVKLWGDVQKQNRPAIFQAEHGESTVGSVTGKPPLRTFKAMLFIYTDAGVSDNDNSAPAVQLNNIIDAIEIAFRPDVMTGRQTLNGLVHSVIINGEILKVPGDLDGDGMALIPLEILVP